jgi:hypothetical protein
LRKPKLSTRKFSAWKKKKKKKKKKKRRKKRKKKRKEKKRRKKKSKRYLTFSRKMFSLNIIKC